ncbi:endoplasmic reticulum vesicle transporter-domain-containing protein [Fimicolochytrium jonesii]|uniref:endoplasmic reticulum vesicle transporter-domain-containing protein n=1 Tax=Fimicolochytrium jonesii TaxID=1396493 RepID=UPI0022FF2ECA|nr:endoplasmic reticulum vesicle transporter-domain-containing protein [Fimicolochytrium jonesii]KAI8821795.1 endoplasmic reticulum vesicle transporter-domain-containing protein [Fimicolochytrium jonesii]
MLDRFVRRLSHIDAFPKVQRNIQQPTGSGGLATLLVGVLLAYLTLSEFAQYRAVTQDYEFLVDQTRSNGKADLGLQINLDLTIATPCQQLRADVLDYSGTTLGVSHQLESKEVVFSTKGTRLFRDVSGKDKGVNVHKIVGQAKKAEKEDASAHPNDGAACRVTGALKLAKVSGMLHFTALGHGYAGGHTPHEVMNFTHRIDKLSFGAYYPGLHNPLDRTLELAKTPLDMFQYFIAVVPTIYLDNRRTFGSKVLLTNQYAVTDYQRSLEGQAVGGVPGIFIKYDIEPIMVRITESHQGFLNFLTRLCGIIGGIFVTIGILLDVIRWMMKWF